jgi:hypothetical protein
MGLDDRQRIHLPTLIDNPNVAKLNSDPVTQRHQPLAPRHAQGPSDGPERGLRFAVCFLFPKEIGEPFFHKWPHRNKQNTP